jgi:hypothetical protein
MNTNESHHSDTFTIRANPSWSIAHSPLIFFKTFFADHEPTGATPAERLFLFAAMTDKLPAFSFSIAFGPIIFAVHDTSSFTQS